MLGAEGRKGDQVHRGSVFAGSALGNVILPSTLRTLEERTFMGCTGQMRVRLPSHLESIKKLCFAGTYYL